MLRCIHGLLLVFYNGILQQLCDTIKEVSGGVAVGIPLKADCNNEEEVNEMFKHIKSFGSIDILVSISLYPY